MHIIIMAGGKGTRISEIANDIPKPMIPICGKPILEHQINCISRQGYKDITLVIGHLGHTIREYFNDGSDFGVNINYIEETAPLGTAGALYYFKDIIHNDFMLINGDIIFDINIKKFYNYHNSKNALATLFTHPNNHPYDSGIIIAKSNGVITNWLHKEEKRDFYKNRVNAGIHLFSPEILDLFKNIKKVDLDRDILKPLISTGRLYVYDSSEYVKDMGTPERYYSVSKDIKCGKVEAKNLINKQKAVFLDRDGTINKYKNFISDTEELELIDGVAEAIKKINQSGYLAIVITNQPVIARGECTIEKLEEIHNKLETLLGKEGAYLDAIYYCPHHPDKGFEGEILEYKIVCNCRKPKPGLIFDASKDFNIDVSNSYMVGDSIHDVNAGKAAGCHTVLITDNLSSGSEADLTYSSVLEFVEYNIN